MIENIKYAITRIPPLSMAAGITTQQENVDAHLARRQHQKYIDTLKSLGIDVTVLEPLEHLPDSHFVEDTTIIHNNVAILTRPGAPERRAEVDAIRIDLKKHLDVVELGGGDNAFVDGGDVLFMGEHVFVGLSYRTNIAGAGALKKILYKLDPVLNVHFIPFDGVLHLKSGITAFGRQELFGNPLMALSADLPAGTVHWLPDAEGYAANALTVNKSTLYFEECPSVAELALQHQLSPIPMNMSEFRKMDGSFTCLSVLW